MSSKSASADELLNSLVTYICIVSPSLVHVCAMQSTDFLTTERDGPQYQGMLARSRGSMGQTQPGPFKNDWGPIFPCSTARESDVSKWFNCMALESDFFFSNLPAYTTKIYGWWPCPWKRPVRQNTENTVRTNQNARIYPRLTCQISESTVVWRGLYSYRQWKSSSRRSKCCGLTRRSRANSQQILVTYFDNEYCCR